MVEPMSTSMENLSTKIVNNGVENICPYTGSVKFSVKVQRGLPNFLSSVNLDYVKLGYQYLITHGVYIVIWPILALILGSQLRNVTWVDFDYSNANLVIVGFLSLVIVYFYSVFVPRPTYLVDFACYCPPMELKVSKEEFINLARKSGNFDETSLKFQENILKSSGIGDKSYLPKSIFNPGFQKTLKQSREEAATVIFGAIDDLFSSTKINPKDIRILVVNCSTLNITPSVSAMVINHYKLKHDICSFNLGGMGCSAGMIAVDLAKDLLNVYKGCYALVVSAEVISQSWYTGKDREMLFPNCFLRMGAASILLSSCRVDRWRAKYELKQVVWTYKGMDNKSFNSVQLKEDKEGKLGLSVSKQVIELGGQAIKANITTLSPLVLPFTEQFRFFSTLLLNNSNSKPYIPNYKRAFEHICIIATSKKVLDEIERNLELSKENMEASRRTLERFGNTSSSSVWYELAYLESCGNKVKRGDRIWQIAFGSGIKCNSAFWKALKTIQRPKRSPWLS